MSNSDETLIFLHMPKAGGTTLHHILERQFPWKQIYTFDGNKPYLDVERFRNLPQAERARYRLLKGHIWFGLHTAVPNPSTYFTLLRDPVERVISQYYYAKSLPTHYMYQRLNQKGISLYEYAAQRMTPEIANQQTGKLAGQHVRTWAQQPTRETLELAKQNLQMHFRVVGLTEYFDTTLMLLQRAFGWKTLLYLHENVTKEKPKRTEIDTRARELLMELNALDVELYTFVQGLFDAQCRAYGNTLDTDLAQFRQRNARYQQFVGPWIRLRRTLANRFGT
jgi:hypothetical protein